MSVETWTMVITAAVSLVAMILSLGGFYVALRKEMRQEVGDLREEMNQRIDRLIDHKRTPVGA